jgi:hypothetical protein
MITHALQSTLKENTITHHTKMIKVAQQDQQAGLKKKIPVFI